MLTPARTRGTPGIAGRIAADHALALAKRASGAPAWPSMRGDHRNSGRMRAEPIFRNDLGIRHFRSGNAIFSTPVIGADETIYVGSADHVFYALDPVANKERWRYDVGEVIDSAATIGEDGSIYVPSGNGLYAFRPDGTKRWHLDLLKEESHVSPSTIYWWEGNAVVGPNGWIYAGCDDFHIFAIDPSGNIRWKTMTGCCIWTAACFGPDDTVYLVSFDFRLYALDALTGRVKWTRNMKNFVTSSPMLAPDGTLYLGSFDKSLYALDSQSGRLKWSMETGGPIYATPAIDDEGLLYLGSCDGNVYCIDPATKSLRWTFYTGDCVRCSVSLGPDPEGTCPFLAYVGSGNGTVYAFEPGGACRWSYDTLAGAKPNVQYCNINASIALGRHGLATASANGDIIYIPYTVARTHAGRPGFTLRPKETYPKDGVGLYPVSPGGVLSTRDSEEAPISLDPADTVSLRIVHRENGRTIPSAIDPATLAVTLPEGLPYRAFVTPDGAQVNLLPMGAVPAGTHEVTVTASYAAGGKTHNLTSRCRLAVRSVHGPTSVEGMSFRIEQMSIYTPSVVASFDQIGIASLAIDVDIVRHDLSTGAVTATGIQTFGLGPDGEPVHGIPVPRVHRFAFEGSYRDGTLILEARRCHFEITAFPVPLDALRFTATVTDAGVIASSMFAEVRLRSALWRTLVSWLPFSGGATGFLRRGRLMRDTVAAWFPERGRLKSVGGLWTGMRLMFGQWFWIAAARVWRPWGMIDRKGWFAGVGTFVAAPRPSL